MNYKVGDRVKVVQIRTSFTFWPFRPFRMPGRGFPRGRIRGAGVITEVIEPSQSRGITNLGSYRVKLDDGTTHYFSEAELRLVEDQRRQ